MMELNEETKQGIRQDIYGLYDILFNQQNDPDHIASYGGGNHARHAYDYLIGLEDEMGSVLDLGCGQNNFCQWLRSRGVKAQGVDIACQSADIKANIIDLPVPSQSYDYVTAFHCLENLPDFDIERAFQEMYRIAKKGLILSIAYRPANKVVRGVNLHLTVKPEEWWLKYLEPYGDVQIIERENHRYIHLRLKPPKPKLNPTEQKVYDFFLFRNELSMLNARLHELDEIVDKFVLIESDKTFSDQPKELVYQQNQELFKKFSHKIVHVVLNDVPSGVGTTDLDREHYHRKDGFIQGLMKISEELKPDDLILYSDLDEIPRIDTILRLLTEPTLLEKGPLGMVMKFYYYHFRCEIVNRVWVGTVALKASQIFKIENMGVLRNERGNLPKLENAGWHCSFFFSPEGIIEKMKAVPDRKKIYHVRDWDVDDIQRKIDECLDLIDRDKNDFKIKKNEEMTDLPQHHQLMFLPVTN